jgi:hypothetical protein
VLFVESKGDGDWLRCRWSRFFLGRADHLVGGPSENTIASTRTGNRADRSSSGSLEDDGSMKTTFRPFSFFFLFFYAHTDPIKQSSKIVHRAIYPSIHGPTNSSFPPRPPAVDSSARVRRCLWNKRVTQPHPKHIPNGRATHTNSQPNEASVQTALSHSWPRERKTEDLEGNTWCKVARKHRFYMASKEQVVARLHTPCKPHKHHSVTQDEVPNVSIPCFLRVEGKESSAVKLTSRRQACPSWAQK